MIVSRQLCRPVRGLILVIAFAIASPAFAATKEWTILIFMNGKNDLERFALEDFAELSRVGSSDQVNFVVEMGRPARRPGEQAAMRRMLGGWSGVRRFHVAKGSTPAPGSEVEVVGGSEIDMGSPLVLQNFLAWGKARYPAKKYAVVVWNHGQGYRMTFDAAGNSSVTAVPRRPGDPNLPPTHRAVSQDADTGSIIYNSDLRSAIASNFGQELSLIGFDACLMAMVETAYEMKDLAPVLVASEELEPGQGWNYTTLGKALTSSPTVNGQQLAGMIVSSYRDNYGDNDSTTLSALDLKQVSSLASELSRLSDMILQKQTEFFPLVSAARATRGAYNDPANPVSIDLIGFLKALEEQAAAAPGNAMLRAQIGKTMVAARRAVVANYASEIRGEPWGSHGIAIYFPATLDDFNNDAWSEGYLRSNDFKPISFVASERWSVFLAAYLGLPE